MPRLAAPLTELQIRKAKPKDQAYFLADGNGLVLWISPAGLKAWRVRYRLADGSRPAPATVGHYPQLSLADARVKAIEVRRDAMQGKITAGVRKAKQKAIAAQSAEQEAVERERMESDHASLRAVSGRWMAEKRPTWATETYRKARLVVDSYLIPALGERDLRTLETKDVRPVLIEMVKETPQLARKARQYLGSIVDHAINEGLRPDESRLRLDRILPTYRSGHMPAVTDDDSKLGDVMRAIDAYPNRVVRAALILAALTAMRSGVVASARWEEIDLEIGEWRIPGMNLDGTNRMKTGQDFSTSLPEQALIVLREMHDRTMASEYVFPPQARQNSPHLSRDALSKALRDMGFQGAHTTHGFRASLRTIGRERLGIDVDVLEAQLAHAPKDEVQAAYARVKFREKRREIMQEWADYLDTLKMGDSKPELRKGEQRRAAVTPSKIPSLENGSDDNGKPTLEQNEPSRDASISPRVRLVDQDAVINNTVTQADPVRVVRLERMLPRNKPWRGNRHGIMAIKWLG